MTLYDDTQQIFVPSFPEMMPYKQLITSKIVNVQTLLTVFVAYVLYDLIN